ncbi:MAG TPA: mannose-1-phosphate guanyltransferase [Leptolyngbyaceae cyanobacterium M65_K2018_010]|nr:mannose-1-phosphate guanyltransferase [Leptolyngbyaceae cyanobacterium M65_K2018_010]
MRAVLMAGGSGTRLRPLTCDLPKPMVPILNRPIAEHILNLLKRHGITEVIATLHYLPDILRDYFQDGRDFGVQMTYAVEEDQPLGTAGCVKNIADLLDDTFLVISGDSVTDFDLQAALRFHRQVGSKATLVLTRVPNPLEFGVVITSSEGQVQRFLEKPSTSEIFSDTVNTGTYILEPDVLEYLPAGQESDFSKDLFPLLLAKGVPLYGYVAEGYWCDVGHLEAYRDAQYAALHRQVRVDYAYPEISPGVWIGDNTQIDPSATLHPPVMIGHNCRIGAGTVLAAGTVIGDNVTIGNDADLKHPIIWNGALIGDEVHLLACTIARGVRVDRRSQILEGAVIGPLSTVGEEATIKAGVRVWPSKQIESGATLNINLIWGNRAQRNLFGQRGVSGLANIDITPEFAVKLGAAFGSTLKIGSRGTVSRAQRTISRMVSRSLIAGLMSVGIHIYNLEATAIPVARSVLAQMGVAGGIHVRLHPDRPDHVLIEFFDEQGIDISKGQEKKIEAAYFKEDLRRAAIDEIGRVTNPAQAVSTYTTAFERKLNIAAVLHSQAKVVIDYVYAVSGAILPEILGKFGCDAVVLNASLRPSALSNEEREVMLGQLGQVVQALRATFGAQVSANGEQLILVDEMGTSIRGEPLTALMADMMLTHHPRGTIVVPVQASGAVELIARRHDGHVIRTKANPTALMQACQANPNVILGGSGDMGFIFPDLHPGFDAMFCIAKLIEMLTLQGRSLGQIWADLPRMAHRVQTLRCPWAVKGALMRYLVEETPPDRLELIDGVKILGDYPDDWVLVLPDAGEPLVHLVVNSQHRDWLDENLAKYQAQVLNFIEHETGRKERTPL